MTVSVMVVYGTRPEAIKIAPLAQALGTDPRFRLRVVSTGQHREMTDQVNRLFGIVPDIDLDLMAPGASVSGIFQRVLAGMEEVLQAERPDAVVVQGDTTSACAAGLAAFLAGVPVVHLEAGLRTGDLSSPFPEEANRRLTAVLASLHLAPTASARANLEAEGVDPRTIVVTGNTVVDALYWTIAQPFDFGDRQLAGLGVERRLVLVTTHRRESWGAPMKEAMQAIAEVAGRFQDVDFVLPMHRNPVVRQVVDAALGVLPNVRLTEPLDYAEFAHLMKNAYVVVSDSGGIQEEAPGLGKPVLVLRDTTERPEGLEAGTVRLVGTQRSVVVRELELLLTDPDAYAVMANAVNPYGDGLAAGRAVAAISALLCGTDRPEEFDPTRILSAPHSPLQ